MLMLHPVIISTIPLSVPLEWNVSFMFCAGFLFANSPAGDGYGLCDMTPGLLVGVVVFALFPIVLGAFWPQYVSFLIGLKQYAGNWASTTWSFSDREKEDRLNERIVKAADNQIDQLEPLFGREISEIFMQKAIAFRMMHPMGRAHITLHMRHNPDMDSRVLREGEFISNSLTGWNFGDGHCHDERLIEAVQERCNYAPGELVVVFTESQPMFDKKVLIPLPDPVTRRAILDIHLSKRGFQVECALDDLVDLTEGLSGRELESLVKEVTNRMVAEENKQIPDLVDRGLDAVRQHAIRTRPLGLADFERARRLVHPVTTPEHMKRYEEWRDTGEA